MCCITKPTGEFYKCKSRPDGLAKRCKSCDREITARYRVNHPDKRRDTKSRWYESHKDRWAEYRKARAQRLGPAIQDEQRDYYEANRPQFAARVAERRARAHKATPAWADPKAIKSIYAEARRMFMQTGVKHHVDHIVPLKNRLVCGLHCEANLRVIPAQANFSKNNRYWPDMPNGR